MKFKLFIRFYVLLMALPCFAQAQQVEIIGFPNTGDLVWSNVDDTGFYTVEWNSALTNTGTKVGTTW